MPEPALRSAERRAVALRHPNFVRYLSARFLVAVAVQMQTVAVGAQVYALTRRPLDLGLIGLSQIVPFLILVLPAGHLADRRDRRSIVILCATLQGACALAFTVFAAWGLAAVWPVFAVMAVFGVARAFSLPASAALLPNLVPAEALGSAIGINSSAWQLATIAGPAIGGILYGAFGPVTAYASATALLLLSIVVFSLVQAPAQAPAREELTLKRLLDGLHFVWQRRTILGAISLDLFAILLGGVTALLPAYAIDVLQIGPQGLGWLRAAPGIGAALIGAWLTWQPLARRVGPAMFGGVAVFGLMVIVFAVSRSLALSLVALAVLGAADMISIYVRHMLVQLETPDDMRGRVGAVSYLFVGAGNELGEFESGVTAAWWGLVRSVVIGGLATLAVAGLWSRWFPALFHMDRLPAMARRRT